MSLFNDKINSISLKEFLLVIVLLNLIWFLINQFIFSVSSNWVYVFIILYFSLKLRNHYSDFKDDLFSIFSNISISYILLIIILNIFFSYGMLYLSEYALNNIPTINYLLTLNFPIKSLFGILSVLGIIVVSPISEELIFRGIIFNKLKLVVPVTFAVLISSLFFGLLHPFGSMISAFVFAICMVLIYQKTENILVPIFAHFLNNIIAECISHFDSSNVLFTNGLAVEFVSILSIISAILIFVLFIGNGILLNNLKIKLF